jgi:hypothetical protein
LSTLPKLNVLYCLLIEDRPDRAQFETTFEKLFKRPRGTQPGQNSKQFLVSEDGPTVGELAHGRLRDTADFRSAIPLDFERDRKPACMSRRFGGFSRPRPAT